MPISDEEKDNGAGGKQLGIFNFLLRRGGFVWQTNPCPTVFLVGTSSTASHIRGNFSGQQRRGFYKSYQDAQHRSPLGLYLRKKKFLLYVALLEKVIIIIQQTASLVELHEVPLDAILFLQSINCTTQFGEFVVSSEFAESELSPTLHAADTDIEHCWSQYRPLKSTTCHSSPLGP
ncbi:hypothetical protein DUI87_09164 [Hirundo rustica rustica]|uniref:Uncharacterized protein n=1 Tax=Hirundo rustica rustica TaxID=333673 RepID=A0A3M0KLX0_HIRRU|nr:hypothetical protein DUI87_09164 [Hirundo rustica rustica]